MNNILRFFSGRARYSDEEWPTAQLVFPQVQCARLKLGHWEHFDRAATSGGGGYYEWVWHNKYATTIHAASSCAIKLSKLTRAGALYRGCQRSALPRAFWEGDETRGQTKGGVEFGKPPPGVELGAASASARPTLWSLARQLHVHDGEPRDRRLLQRRRLRGEGVDRLRSNAGHDRSRSAWASKLWPAAAHNV